MAHRAGEIMKNYNAFWVRRTPGGCLVVDFLPQHLKA